MQNAFGSSHLGEGDTTYCMNSVFLTFSVPAQPFLLTTWHDINFEMSRSL